VKQRGRGPCRRPVSRILSRTIIPLGDTLPRRSSNLPASFGLRLPGLLHLGASGRCARAAGVAAAVPAYLVLLRVGFTMRRSLLAVRCALTAPFHPYLPAYANGRYIFCCTGRLYALKHKSRVLPGTLPCGVRTFLPLRGKPQRQRSSSRLQINCTAVSWPFSAGSAP